MREKPLEHYAIARLLVAQRDFVRHRKTRLELMIVANFLLAYGLFILTVGINDTSHLGFICVGGFCPALIPLYIIGQAVFDGARARVVAGAALTIPWPLFAIIFTISQCFAGFITLQHSVPILVLLVCVGTLLVALFFHMLHLILIEINLPLEPIRRELIHSQTGWSPAPPSEPPEESSPANSPDLTDPTRVLPATRDRLLATVPVLACFGIETLGLAESWRHGPLTWSELALAALLLGLPLLIAAGLWLSDTPRGRVGRVLAAGLNFWIGFFWFFGALFGALGALIEAGQSVWNIPLAMLMIGLLYTSIKATTVSTALITFTLGYDSTALRNARRKRQETAEADAAEAEAEAIEGDHDGSWDQAPPNH